MPALRAVASSAALAAVFGVGFLAGCYSERATPPTYRYPCSSSDECPEDESCVEGLCQIPCSQATFADDCPQNGSYLACFNGVCAGGCEVDQDQCPNGTECIDFGVEPSGGGFIGGGSEETIGVCGRMCETGASSCPTGEVCIEGFCVATCDPNIPDPICPSGFECVLGLCAPPGFGPMTASAEGGDDGGSDGGSDTADDPTATTLDGTTTLMDPDGPVTDGGTMGVDGGAR